jgi:hypothetical protein
MIRNFHYAIGLPLKLADANRFAVAIASNDNIERLFLYDKGRIFREEGTFECMFDAFLKNSSIQALCLTLSFASIEDIVGRNCIGNSKLGSNTTLKRLGFFYIPGSIHHAVVDGDEGMKQLAKVIKVNRGLEHIWISPKFMTNKGRRYILDGVRDNINLVGFSTDEEIDEEENNERDRVLQFQIEHYMELNKDLASIRRISSVGIELYLENP